MFATKFILENDRNCTKKLANKNFKRKPQKNRKIKIVFFGHDFQVMS
jgi:hypothetical protein